jgi:MFS family permease
MRRIGPREAAWALSVGVVLADSSVVTLALPEILREYDTSVFGVSWVLTAYNLVLAAAVIPAIAWARRRPGGLWVGGLVVFALASLLAATSSHVAVLIAARCIQAFGGALIVAAAIELLARSTGSHRVGAAYWGAAGTAGLAIGPALGGALTEAFSWQAIFLLQLPLPALALAARAPAARPERGLEGPPDRRPELALALVSAGLTAALFLLVVLLTEGWGMGPLQAALVVSVIPLATLLFSVVRPGAAAPGALAVAGVVAVAGGLGALGVLPGPDAELTIAPQLLVGAGLALAMPVLTQAALGGRDPDGSRAGETIAARHLGIVAGIVLLTPLLSLQLGAQHDAGRDAATALLLDSPLPPATKIEIAESTEGAIDAADGRLPDLDRSFAAVAVEPAEQPALDELRAGIDDQLERAATHAFSLPFLGAALLALAALIPAVDLMRSPR